MAFIYLGATSAASEPLSYSTTMPSSLDQLKATGTVVVSDSGDFECTYNIALRFKIRLADAANTQRSMPTSLK